VDFLLNLYNSAPQFLTGQLFSTLSKLVPNLRAVILQSVGNPSGLKGLCYVPVILGVGGRYQI
jgi:hypothetical protein